MQEAINEVTKPEEVSEEEQYTLFILELAALYKKYNLTYEKIEEWLNRAKDEALVYSKRQLFDFKD